MKLLGANDGAPGVDEVTDEIQADGLQGWPMRLGEEMRTKTYRYQAMQRVVIPKPGSGERLSAAAAYRTGGVDSAL